MTMNAARMRQTAAAFARFCATLVLGGATAIGALFLLAGFYA